MSDLQSTLDAIDQLAVHQCGHCQQPLADDSASLDFCNNVCQTAWTRKKHEIVALLDYEEPTDLPQHVSNLVELASPETTPRRESRDLELLFCDCPMCSHPAVRPQHVGRPAQVYISTNPGADPNGQAQWQLIGTSDPDAPVVRIEPDIQRYREALSRLALSMGAAYGIPAALLGWAPRQRENPPEETLGEQIQRLRDTPALTIDQRRLDNMAAMIGSHMIDRDEARSQLGLQIDGEHPETAQERALRLRRNRSTGPQPRQRAPRRIDARRTR